MNELYENVRYVYVSGPFLSPCWEWTGDWRQEQERLWNHSLLDQDASRRHGDGSQDRVSESAWSNR